MKYRLDFKFSQCLGSFDFTLTTHFYFLVALGKYILKLQFACYKLNFRGIIGKMLLDFLHESPHVEKMWHVMCHKYVVQVFFSSNM